ncbi:MAG: hypothetical protein IPH60_04720 [Flavobacteriales bacterium]|nr:hypothetical protein [Flavobacteriales bacterium]
MERNEDPTVDTTDGLPTLHVNAGAGPAEGRLIAGTDSGGDPAKANVGYGLRPTIRFLPCVWRPRTARGCWWAPTKASPNSARTWHRCPLDERFLGIFPWRFRTSASLDPIRARNGDLWLGTPTGLIHLDKHNGQPA